MLVNDTVQKCAELLATIVYNLQSNFADCFDPECPKTIWNNGLAID